MNVENNTTYWKTAFFEALFPIDLRVINIPYALKKPSSNGQYLDRIIPDRKKTDLHYAFELLENNIPRYLYKYRFVSDYSLANFENDTIWVDHPTSFNDPFDSISAEKDLCFSAVLNALDKSINDKKIEDNELLKKANDTLSKEVIDIIESIYKKIMINRTQFSFSVACLSETNSSILMWSHYANNHKGFCIEHDGKKIYQSKAVNKHLFPVKYINRKEPIIPISSLALEYAGLYSVLCKTEDWAYEKEWRICFGIEDQKGPRNLQLPKATGLYLGARMPKEDRIKLLDIASRKDIVVYEEKLDSMDRVIHFERL